jgi:hypothetical protein
MAKKTLHRKLKIQQHESNYKPEVNSGGPAKLQFDVRFEFCSCVCDMHL